MAGTRGVGSGGKATAQSNEGRRIARQMPETTGEKTRGAKDEQGRVDEFSLLQDNRYY